MWHEIIQQYQPRIQMQSAAAASFDEAFQYTLDKSHKFDVRSPEDLMSTLFQIEYTKQTQGQTVFDCSKQCFQSWRQEDLSKPEKECLSSCFTRSNLFYDQFYSRSVRFNEQVQRRGLQGGSRLQRGGSSVGEQ